MKTYEYVEPIDPINNDWSPVYILMTELEIIQLFWCYWSAEMAKVGKPELITTDNCIEDWVTVNWAFEVDNA